LGLTNAKTHIAARFLLSCGQSGIPTTPGNHRRDQLRRACPREAWYTWEEFHMPKYLVEATYLSEGVKGLLKEGGTRRREAVDELFKSLGGKVEAMYFAFGDQDVFIIGELPDNASAVALVIKVNAAGLSKCKTTVLLTAKEIDEAVKKNSIYRPPGYEIAREVAKWEGEGGHLAQDTAPGKKQ
jgi:uncharacterized protein with GYD domain